MFFSQRFNKQKYYSEINPNCDKIVLSDRAYATIIAEAYQRINTETGGILLGHYDNGTWFVVEVIDPGMKASYSTVEFEYDGEYVTHLLKKVSRIYKYELHFLGAWHRHPGSMDTFSHTDDIAHKNIVKWAGNGAISLLVNFDPNFRISPYYVDDSINYWKIKNLYIGDKYCNPKVLQLREHEDCINQVRKTSVKHTECFEEKNKTSVDLMTQFRKQYIEEIQNNIDYYSSNICEEKLNDNNLNSKKVNVQFNLFDQTKLGLLNKDYSFCLKVSSANGFSPHLLKKQTTILQFNETHDLKMQLELLCGNNIVLETSYSLDVILGNEIFNIYLIEEPFNNLKIEMKVEKR